MREGVVGRRKRGVCRNGKRGGTTEFGGGRREEGRGSREAGG